MSLHPRCWLVVLGLMGGTALLNAQSAKRKPTLEETLTAETKPGAARVEVSDQVTFRVPQGFRYATGEKLLMITRSGGAGKLTEETLAVMPNNFAWTAFIGQSSDPLHGLDPTKLDDPVTAAKLLEWQMTLGEKRRSLGGSLPTRVSGFTHHPTFDQTTKVLTLGVRFVDENGQRPDMVCHQIYALGTDGTVGSICLFCDSATWQRAVSDVNKLASEFEFTTAHATPTVTPEEELKLPLPLVVVVGGVSGVGLMLLFLRLFNGPSKPSSRGIRRPWTASQVDG